MTPVLRILKLYISGKYMMLRYINKSGAITLLCDNTLTPWACPALVQLRGESHQEMGKNTRRHRANTKCQIA